MTFITPFWFFLLAEICGLLALLLSFACWKWIRFKRQLESFGYQWASTRQMIEGAISGLQTVSHSGGDQVRIKLEYLELTAAVFRKEPEVGVIEWRSTIDPCLKLFDCARVKAQSATGTVQTETAKTGITDESTGSLTDEPSDLDLTPLAPVFKPTSISMEKYQSVIDSIDSQHTKLQELMSYKQAVVALTSKLQRINVANHKLLDYVRVYSAQDENFRPLQQMLEKFHQSGADIEASVTELSQDRHQFEPKLTSLMQENQTLSKALQQYRKQLEKVIEERDRLDEIVKEQENKLAIRNKSYARLHSKFEALRREYITLFEMSGKSAQSRGPISTS